MSLNFCFIGAGNLATNLSKALKKKGYNIVQVYSRTEKSAKELASVLASEYTTSPECIKENADVYFVCLNDAAVSEVLPHISLKNCLVVHCSGSLPLSVLENYSENTGVFYPLQTFSKYREVDFSEIPVFIESNSLKNQEILLCIARSVSNSVNVIDSQKRMMLHISAVFACNFVNHLYVIAAEIAESNQVQFEVLRPLILETAKKVQEMAPDKAQTGPAVRSDDNIIRLHLDALNSQKSHRELYSLISNSIFEYYKK